MKKIASKKIVIRLFIIICFSFMVMTPSCVKAETNTNSQFTTPTVTFDGATIRSDSKSGIRFKITVSNASKATHCGIILSYGGKSITVSTEDEKYRNIYAADTTADTVEYTVVVYGIPESAFSSKWSNDSSGSGWLVDNFFCEGLRERFYRVTFGEDGGGL